MCYQVQRSLYKIASFGTARTTIGICRSLVRKDDITTSICCWNVMTTTYHWQGKSNGNDIGKELQVGAKVRDDMHLQAGDLAIFRSSDLKIVNLIASMNGHRKILTAFFNPFDGTSCLHSCKGNQCLFRIYVELRAKTAANFRYDYAHLMLWKS